MPFFIHNHELLVLMKSVLTTPVIVDILESFGLCHQILPQYIQPLAPDMKIAGEAMTVLMTDEQNKTDSLGKLGSALEQLREGEIYIASGGLDIYAYWGEMMTAAAKNKKASGAIVNGFHRDTPKILEQDWPVFSKGKFARDSSVRTQVIDYRCPIQIGQVTIKPGDFIFGDMDGIAVIPRQYSEEIIELAVKKAQVEIAARREIENGASFSEVVRKYGIV